MPRQWYIKSRSGFQGPFSSRVLRRLACKGKLTPNTGVSPDGETWFKAKQVSGLDFASSSSQTRDASSETPTRWYIQTKRSVAGPVSISKLTRLARAGKIQPSVAVSHDLVRWIKAKRVPGVVFDVTAFEATSATRESSKNQQAPQTSPDDRIALPVIGELPISGPLPQLSDLPVRRNDVVAIRLPVVQEVPLLGPRPEYKDFALRDAVALPVVQELPITGPLPLLSDMPLRRADVIGVGLPVVQEIPIAGPLPTYEQYSPRPKKPVELPVIADLPIAGPLPQLTDLPLRRADVITIALPVIQDLPIAGNVTTLGDIAPKKTAALPDTFVDFGQLRRAAYIQQFGPIWQVDGSRSVSESAVDICIQPGSSQRPFTTLITNGMSDIAMEVPEGRWSPRAELVLYAREPHPAYISLLRSIAKIPIGRQRGFHYGSTMSNGDPSRPIFANSKLDSFVFMIPAIRSDFQVSEHVMIDNAPLQLLWVVPITTAEQNFLHENGMKSFFDLLNQCQHSPIIDPQRQCYIETSSQNVG